MKKLINKIYFIICVILEVPLIFLHELTHSVAYFMVKLRIGRIKIIVDWKNHIIGGESVHGVLMKRWHEVFIAFAPFLVPLTVFVLMIVLNSEFLCAFFIYEICYMRITFPSKTDLKNARTAINDPNWF